MNPKINHCLKNKLKEDYYRVQIRYYDGNEEHYISTEYKVKKEKWEAKNPENDVLEKKKELNDKILALRTKLGDNLTPITFRKAWEGGTVTSGDTLVELCEKHLALGKAGQLIDRKGRRQKSPYAKKTRILYEYTAEVLKLIQAGVLKKDYVKAKGDSEDDKWLVKPNPLRCSQFNNMAAFVDLQGWFTLAGKKGIGGTTLSIHMQNIKAFCRTGHDPHYGINWIPNDSYDKYGKPPREVVGTQPVSEDDFKKILGHKSTKRNKDHREAIERGRDFWCAMVYAGGMEAIDIANLQWSKVDEFQKTFRYIRSKSEDNQNSEAIFSFMNYPIWIKLIQKYGVRGGKYVFPVLTEGMTEDQEHNAVIKFATRISKAVTDIGESLNLKVVPTCKTARPTFATIAYDNKASIYSISKMMNHKSIKTTEIYLSKMPTKMKLDISNNMAGLMPALDQNAMPVLPVLPIEGTNQAA